MYNRLKLNDLEHALRAAISGPGMKGTSAPQDAVAAMLAAPPAAAAKPPARFEHERPGPPERPGTSRSRRRVSRAARPRRRRDVQGGHPAAAARPGVEQHLGVDRKARNRIEHSHRFPDGYPAG